MLPGGRESYYQALYDRLKSAVTVVDPKNVLWSMPFETVPPTAQPALVMHIADQQPVADGTRPPAWYLGAVVEVFVRGSDERAASVINGIIDQMESAFERVPNDAPRAGEEQNTGYYTTLGGKVAYCKISDTIVFENVEQTGQAVALVPVVMCIP